MSLENDRLDPRARALLDEVEPRDRPLPDALRERMRARMAIALAASSGPLEAPGAASTAPASASPARASLPWRILPHVGSAAIGATLATLVVQVASPPRVVYVDRPVPVVASAAPGVSPPPLASAPPSAVSASTPLAVPPRSPSSPPPAPARPLPAAQSDDPLVAEARLIDAARAAFSRGDLDAALASIEVHEARYPNGRLAEEREALAVQALADAGREDEARARGERFRQRYPKSLLRDAVESALAPIR